MWRLISYSFFFFNDTATTEIYTLSLHDALPILNVVGATLTIVQPERSLPLKSGFQFSSAATAMPLKQIENEDRKSTRLNSSHSQISYAVFCLKKKKT